MTPTRLYTTIVEEHGENISVFDEWSFTSDTILGMYVQHVTATTEKFIVAILTEGKVTFLYDGYSATAAYILTKDIYRFAAAIQQSAFE